MSALDHTVLHLRNITKNLNSQFFLQKFLHSRIQHRRHLIKDHTSDMAVFSVFHKTPDISSQRYAHPPAVHDQNNRCICHFGKIIGTGSGCRSRHTVIKSHNAFHDCNLTVLCSFWQGDIWLLSDSVKKVSRFRDFVPITRLWNIGSI